MQSQGASSQQIEEAMTSLEKEIRDVLDDPESTDQFWLGHARRRWSTFATASAAQNLVKSKAKLFVAHGSEDKSVPIESFSCRREPCQALLLLSFHK